MRAADAVPGASLYRPGSFCRGVCSALQSTDWLFQAPQPCSLLGKGGNLKAMLAEIYGKGHWLLWWKDHASHRSAGASLSNTNCGKHGSHCLGAATAQREGKGRVVVVFLGDGAMEAGVVHES